jgi:hypothetical protein
VGTEGPGSTERGRGSGWVGAGLDRKRRRKGFRVGTRGQARWKEEEEGGSGWVGEVCA